MAIQIPSVDRFAPQEPGSVGRVQAEAPNLAANSTVQLEGIGKVAKEVGDYFIEQEEYALDTAATRGAIEYELRVKKGAAEAKNYEGDPTTVYNTLATDSKGWAEEIVNADPNASERLKNRIRAKIQGVDFRLSDNIATAQATQYAAYQKNVTDAAVKLGQENVLSTSELLNVKEPNSFVKYQMSLDEIQKLRLENGLKNGTVSISQDGKISADNFVKLQIRKDQSEAIYNSIFTLSAAGQTEEANELLTRYSDTLLAEQKVKLERNVKDSADKNAAISAADKLSRLDPIQALKAVDDMKATPEVKELTRKFLDDRSRRADLAEQRSQKRKYEVMSRYVEDRQNGPNGFVSKNDLQQDETYKAVAPTLSAKQRRALEQTVEMPTTSNVDSVIEIQDALRTGEMVRWDAATLQENLVGLNQKHRDMYTRIWNSANSKTGSEEYTRVKYMLDTGVKEMSAQGITSKKGRMSPSKKTKADREKESALQDAIIEAERQLPPNSSTKDLTDAAKQIVTNYKKNEVFTYTPKVRLQSAPPPPKNGGDTSTRSTPPPKSSVDASTFSEEEQRQWFAKFRKVNGRRFDASKGDNIQKFIDSQGGKL